MSEYVVHPYGDLLITNHPPVGSFALWDEPEDLLDVAVTGRTPDHGECAETDMSTPKAFDSDRLSALGTNAPAIDASSSIEPAPGVLLKVSSSHLILASDRAKRMLIGPWKEANAAYPENLRHWDIEGCLDSTALTIVMDIIHGRTRRVPRSLELDMLAKVAVVVDDLQCHEAVEVFSDMWIGKLDYLPTQYTRDLVLWIFIASVFQQQELLDSAMRTAILQCTDEFRTLSLPIPTRIVGSYSIPHPAPIRTPRLDAIDTERQELLRQAIMALDTLFERLGDDDAGCSLACRTALLGALVRQMRSKQLLWPPPSKPFPGLSFASLAADVRCFQSPVFYIPVERDPYAPDEPREDEEVANFAYGRTKKKGNAHKTYCAECFDSPDLPTYYYYLLHVGVCCAVGGQSATTLAGKKGKAAKDLPIPQDFKGASTKLILTAAATTLEVELTSALQCFKLVDGCTRFVHTRVLFRQDGVTFCATSPDKCVGPRVCVDELEDVRPIPIEAYRPLLPAGSAIAPPTLDRYVKQPNLMSFVGGLDLASLVLQELRTCEGGHVKSSVRTHIRTWLPFTAAKSPDDGRVSGLCFEKYNENLMQKINPNSLNKSAFIQI